MDDHLLAQLYASGERLRAALDGADMDQIEHALHVRDGLVRQLRTYDHPADVCDDWQAYADRLNAQHAVLSEAMQAHEDRLREAQQGARRLRGARRTYAAPAGASRGRFLGDGLSG